MLTRFACWIYRIIYGTRSVKSKSLVVQSATLKARVAEQDIDRFHYPPPPNGIPFIEVDLLLERHQSTLNRIQFSTGDNESFFQKWYMPLVYAYAKFVHLLPASENSHHSLPGGMLAHGLEVALSAMLKADRAIVGMHKVPEQRIFYEKKWKLAVFVAAIAHDIGKPLSDILVHDDKGNQWSPYLDSLYDWGKHSNAVFYVITWNRNRYKQHEAMTTEALNYILTPEIKNFLYDDSPEILTLLMSAISGAENQIKTIVTQADQESSALDAKRNPIRTSDMKYGIPVSVHLKDALSKFLSSLKPEDINNDGSHVFYLTDGLYLKWPDVMEKLMEHLPTQQLIGIPSSPPQFADILIDAGLAKAGEGLFSSKMRTWRITKGKGQVREGWFLKITSWDLFLDSFEHQTISGGTWVPTSNESTALPNEPSLEVDQAQINVDEVVGSGKISKSVFEKYGNIGEILYTLLVDLLAGKIRSGIGEPIIMDAKDLPILWSYVQSQGIPAKTIMDEVRAIKIHKPFEGTKQLHPIDDKQYLVLNEEVREVVRSAFEELSVSKEPSSNFFSEELMSFDYIKMTDEAIKEGDKTVPEFAEDENGKLLEVAAWKDWLNKKTGTSLYVIERAILKQVRLEYFVVTQDQKRYIRVD